MNSLKRLGAAFFAASMLSTINVANAEKIRLNENVRGVNIELIFKTNKKKMELFVNGSKKCSYKLGNINALGRAKSCIEKTGARRLAGQFFDIAMRKIF